MLSINAEMQLGNSKSGHEVSASKGTNRREERNRDRHLLYQYSVDPIITKTCHGITKKQNTITKHIFKKERRLRGDLAGVFNRSIKDFFSLLHLLLRAREQ